VGKRKPDQTVNLRIELQDFERKALANQQTATAIKDFAEAIDKLTSFENFYLLVTLAEVVTGKEIIPGTPNDVYKLIDYVRDYIKENPMKIPDKGVIPGVDSNESLLETLFKLTPFGIPFAVADEVL